MRHVIRYREYEQLQLFIEEKRGIGRNKRLTNTARKNLIHQAQDREKFIVLIANLSK